MKKCKTCVFYDSPSCHRNPPPFPVTKSDDWCGEYAPKRKDVALVTVSDEMQHWKELYYRARAMVAMGIAHAHTEVTWCNGNKCGQANCSFCNTQDNAETAVNASKEWIAAARAFTC